MQIGVLELLELLEDAAASVRQAACRVLLTLAGFPDVKNELLESECSLVAPIHRTDPHRAARLFQIDW